MATAIGVRGDFSAADLRRSARGCSDPAQVRRLLALAVILDDGSRSEAAKVGGVTLQIVRDWVLRFNAEGVAGLATRKAPGKAPTLNSEQRRALADMVEAGPNPEVHGVVRWRLVDLAQWLWDEFGVSVSRHVLGRELKAMGYRKLSARPRHYGQWAEDIADFKKLPCPSGGDREGAPARHADRDLVAGRSADRSEDPDHPPLGQARHATRGA